MELLNNAEGGTDGVAVTTGNSGGASGSAWDAVQVGSGGSLTYDDTHAYGTLAYRCTSGTSATYLEWAASLGGAHDELWGRLYLYLTAHPSAEEAVVRLRSSGTQSCRIGINTAGQVTIRQAGNSLVATSTASVNASGWTRLEWHAIPAASNGTIEVRIYTDPDSTTIAETLSTTTASMTASVNEVQYGPVGNVAAGTYWIDYLGVNDTGWLGPAVTTPDGTGTITASATLSGTGFKRAGGTGAATGAAVLAGQGTKVALGGGDITATATLAGTGDTGVPAGTPPFPDAPLDVSVQLQLDGVWTSITGDVKLDEPITITRGRQDEGQASDPARCTLKIRNTDGKYSPRNPLSPYYGVLGRNTPIRISVPTETHLRVTDVTGAGATCPDAPSLDIGGDIDVRIELTATYDEWAAGGDLAGRYVTTGDQRSWALVADKDGGELIFIWSPDGTLGSRHVVVSTEPIPTAPGRRSLRATLDVDNGAGGWTVHFYYADTIAGPWTQLGDPVTGSGVTSIHTGTAGVEVGDVAGLTGGPASGRYHAFQVRSGIDGTAVVDLDWSAAAPGAATHVDDTGHTWTAASGAEITDRAIRFEGEVSSWPPRWTVGGWYAWTPVEAAGILRRLGQGAKPLRSAASRAIEGAATPYVAWWPMEDAADATQAASGYAGGTPLAAAGQVEFTGEPVGGTAGGARIGLDGILSATVSGCPDEWAVAVWITPPDTWPDSGATPIVEWDTPAAPDNPLWSLHVERIAPDDPILVVTKLWGDGTASSYTNPIPELLGELPVQVALRAYQQGSNIQTNVYINGVEQTTEGFSPGQAAPITAIRATVRAEGGDLGLLSHLVIAPNARVDELVGHATAGAGYAGETALARIQRIADEESIPLDTIGDEAELVGPQGADTALALIAEAAAVDGGTLHERLSPVGLRYRARTADYNAPPSLTLDYAAGEVAADLEPVEDDLGVRNDVTVERVGGSSARAVDETSALSVNAPPDGIGRYDEAVTVNAYEDAQLGPIAGWRLHLGTVDEPRYPVVPIDLADDPHLIDAVLLTDIRSRIRLTGLPVWVPPGPVDLLVDGYTETIGLLEWRIDYTCVPASPWDVAHLDDPTYGRLDTDGSELAGAVDADDTTLSVASTGAPWVTDPAEFPFSVTVGGEEMTVTAITGTTSPQTFTVVRSVNGIVKSHAAGTDVRLTHPAIIAL